MNAKNEIYTQITKLGLKDFTVPLLMKRLKLSGNFDYRYLSDIVAELIKDGKICKRKGKLALAGKPDKPASGGEAKKSLSRRSFKDGGGKRPSLGAGIGGAPQIIGRIQANPKGFAFLIPDGGGEDIFLPASKLNGAVHNDKVIVAVTEVTDGAGEVVKVLERGAACIVGIFKRLPQYGFVVPDDKKFFKDVYVSKEDFGGAEEGQKVVVKIEDYGSPYKNPSGRITETLGYPDECGTDILSVIRAYNLYEDFPAKVQADAKAAPQSVSGADIDGRADYRGMQTITIDGADARDLDDAVSCAYDVKNKTWTLGVHIADVTHYVKPNTPLDKEAFKRATSVYFPDRVLPMLPRELSNNICSLNEAVDRLTLSAVMRIDSAGKINGVEICESVIKTAHRMTYDEVERIFKKDKAACDKNADVLPMLKHMQKLAAVLTKKRAARGSLDFELPESKIILDERGKTADVVPYPRGESNRLIEEFMLAANESVAEYMFKRNMPFIYRVHENPSAEKMEILAEFVKGLGLALDGDTKLPTPLMIGALLEKTAETPYSGIVSKVALRSMQKAKYFPVNLGHFGLAAKFYCHFTSPIRRYPDLGIHRIIKDYLRNGDTVREKYGEFIAEASAQSSLRERGAEEAEREVDNMKKTEFMHSKLGEHFDGIISGVNEFGVFVELANTCEGLVKLDNLPPDEYTFERNNFILRGRKHEYRLGGAVRIIVAGADVSSRRTEFVLEEHSDDGEADNK
jgi:ribonuclease R